MEPPPNNAPTGALQLVAAEQHNLKSPLLSLPAELRNYIWELVVVRDQPIDATPVAQYISPSYVQGLVKQPPLSQVCRSVRQEVVSIFYGSNDFIAGLKFEQDAVNLEKWLTAIGERNRGYMKCFLVQERVHGEFEDRQGCECCPTCPFLLGMKVLEEKTLASENHVVVDVESLHYATGDARASGADDGDEILQDAGKDSHLDRSEEGKDPKSEDI